MIIRENSDGLVTITQPMHAMVSGQIIQSWGNSEFGNIAPWHETCLAAAIHDIGWMDWETSPTLNPHTGRPHAFNDVSDQTHIEIWSRGPQLSLALGRYVALLVSLHGTALFELHHMDSSQAADSIQAFIDDQRSFRAGLLQSLRNDPRYAGLATPEAVARNQAILRACDGLSLYLCIGLSEPRQLPEVPTASGSTTLTLIPKPDNPEAAIVRPWPFRDSVVSLTCDCRRLPAQFSCQETMRSTIAQAPWMTLVMRLVPE